MSLTMRATLKTTTKTDRLSTLHKTIKLAFVVFLLTVFSAPSPSYARNVAITVDGVTYYVDANEKRQNPQLVDLLLHSKSVSTKSKKDFLKAMPRFNRQKKAMFLQLLLKEQQQQQAQQTLTVNGETYTVDAQALQKHRDMVMRLLNVQGFESKEKQKILTMLPQLNKAQIAKLTQAISATEQQQQLAQGQNLQTITVEGKTYRVSREEWQKNQALIVRFLKLKSYTYQDKQAILYRLPIMTADQRAVFEQTSVMVGTTASKAVPTTPILRLNTAMHTALIRAGAIDKAEQFLVTVSNDRTAKLWSLKNGELLNTLRVPISDSNEGMLSTVVMEPNAEWIAVSGVTGFKWDDKASIYLFNRRNGNLQRRLSGLNFVSRMCVNADGSRLATLHNPAGVIVWDTNTWEPLWLDDKPGGVGYLCDYDSQGNLMTMVDNGHLRRYNSQGKVVADSKISNGGLPHAMALSPDGRRVAVGYRDFLTVSVHDTGTLEKSFDAKMPTIDKDVVTAVAWSQDGQMLYAGAGIDGTEDSESSIIQWAQQGRGSPQLLPGGRDSITGLFPLKHGDLLALVYTPDWFVLGADKQIKLRQSGVGINNRAKLDDAFLIDSQGTQILTGMDSGKANPMSFSVSERRLQPLSDAQRQSLAASGKWLTARTQSTALRVKGWHDSSFPTLNGKRLATRTEEVCRALAIAPDEGSFILGCDSHLYRFNADGRIDWVLPSPEITFGLNLTQSSEVIVAAFGDGTIHWYRRSDGQELLALFIDKQSMEWVLWTPSGYYDASPNGDKLIGWHVNNGKDKTPDFYPAKTLRKQFYRPQVVAQILNTLDEEKAVEVANQMGEKTNAEQTITTALPPTVKIISHRDGDSFNKENITLKVNVSRNNGTAKLKVLIDGEPMAKGRGLAALATDKQQRETLDVTLPKRDVTVSVIAENQMGASPAASVRLKWAGKTTNNNASASGGFVIKPKLYVLAVGVSKYRDPHLRLDFPAKDAADFVKVLQGQKDKLYREVEVKLLTDADKDDIIDGLDWLRENVTAKDVTMLFLSGHGANDRDNNYQFVAADTDVKRLYRSGVSYTDIKNTLTGLSGKRLAFIDTCHSGNIFGTKSKGLSPMADINGIVNDLTAAENGVVVFAASTGKQLSWEDPKWGNGAFTKAVVEGLGGKADYTKDGKITINQLDLYISERVKKLTDNRQTPVTTKPETIPDFPIGVVK